MRSALPLVVLIVLAGCDAAATARWTVEPATATTWSWGDEAVANAPSIYRDVRRKPR